MESKSEIFFSYAWDDENEQGEGREKIVNELYESLLKDKYKVVRDKYDLIYPGLISEFMRRMGRASFIVVAISDKYLKSPNCMFELLEIYKKSKSEITEMKEKIFPIILNDAKIYDPVDRLDYITFWKNKREELDKKIKDVGLEYAAAAVADYEIYRDITFNIATLSGLLKDMNTLNPTILSYHNFAEVKRAIETRVTGDPEVLYKLPNIRKFLTNALNDTELDILCMDHFEKVYNNFAAGQTKSQKINQLLDFCRKNDKFNVLLEVMQEANMAQFEAYKPYV